MGRTIRDLCIFSKALDYIGIILRMSLFCKLHSHLLRINQESIMWTKSKQLGLPCLYDQEMEIRMNMNKGNVFLITN